MPSIRFIKIYAGGLLGSLLIGGGILASQFCDAAVDEHKAPVTASAASAAVPKKTPNGPSWQALTAAQQLALAPLSGEWDSMDSLRKEKWIAIGNKYARMSPAEQARIQTRMRDWIKLTPAQRRTVRRSYNSSKKWDADQKSAQWQQYQQLSDEQKQQLAKQKLSRAPATSVARALPKSKHLLPLTPRPMPKPVPAPVPAPAATAPAAAAATQSTNK
jgi:hypothetical protein